MTKIVTSYKLGGVIPMTPELLKLCDLFIGYRSYLGFLLLEVAHTHPVMISFCHILQEHSQKHRGNERCYIIKTEGMYNISM